MKTKILIPMGLCLLFGFFLGAYLGSPLRFYLSSFVNGTSAKSHLEKVAELEPFQSILGKVVFVTKGIYGGDLRNVCILRGKLRNVTNKPYKDIYVLWMVYGPDGKLFPINPDKYNSTGIIPSLFSDKIDYLDSKSEADFQISIDTEKLGGYMTGNTEIRKLFDSRIEIIEAVRSGREEAGIFIRKELNK